MLVHVSISKSVVVEVFNTTDSKVAKEHAIESAKKFIGETDFDAEIIDYETDPDIVFNYYDGTSFEVIVS